MTTKVKLHRLKIAVWALTAGVAVALASIWLLVYGNPGLV